MFAIRPLPCRSFVFASLTVATCFVVWPVRAHERTTRARLLAGRKVHPFKTRAYPRPKTQTLRFYKHRDAEGPWVIRIREAEGPREVADLFASELNGANLARIVGGPRLRRSGFLAESNAFFLEEERMFVGEQAWSFRGCQDDACLDHMRRVIGSRLVERLARRFVHVLEANLAPNDHNFIFTRRDVRWTDGETWRETEDSTQRELPAALVETLVWLERIDAKRAHEFDRQFMREVLDSLVWSEEQKDSLLGHYARQTRARPELAHVLGALPVRGCDQRMIEIQPDAEQLPN